MTEVELTSSRPIEARDITPLVAAQADHDGLLWLSAPHTTCALLLSEADDELLNDLERVAAELLRPLEPFAHHKNDNPNAAAHLLSGLAGTQLLVPVAAGGLRLGTYQRIVFLELDGPRPRRVRIEQVPVVMD
jgi:secondary thiamine-phosphate synthase enzyme